MEKGHSWSIYCILIHNLPVETKQYPWLITYALSFKNNPRDQIDEDEIEITPYKNMWSDGLIVDVYKELSYFEGQS